jgi:hypothetical protein
LKIIYSASKIKNYTEKSLESNFLSTCKYYVFNSSQLYKQITVDYINCNCINLKDNKISYSFEKAEKSNSINYCKQFAKKALNQLNHLVNNVVSCKQTKKINYFHK